MKRIRIGNVGFELTDEEYQDYLNNDDYCMPVCVQGIWVVRLVLEHSSVASTYQFTTHAEAVRALEGE